MVRLIPLTGVLVGLCSAVLADTENPIVARLIADYRTTCEAELQIEDMRDPTPPPDVDEVLKIDGKNIYELPLTKDLTATVLYAEYKCRWPACGTGGCGGHIIVGEQVFDFHGGRPKSILLPDGDYLLMLSSHGSGCTDAVKGIDYKAPGAAPCYNIARWYGDRFITKNPFLLIHDW